MQAPVGTTYEVWLDGNWQSTTTDKEAAQENVQYWRRVGTWKKSCELIMVERVSIIAFSNREAV